jgi:hypothetical protein
MCSAKGFQKGVLMSRELMLQELSDEQLELVNGGDTTIVYNITINYYITDNITITNSKIIGANIGDITVINGRLVGYPGGNYSDNYSSSGRCHWSYGYWHR